MDGVVVRVVSGLLVGSTRRGTNGEGKKQEECVRETERRKDGKKEESNERERKRENKNVSIQVTTSTYFFTRK